MAVKLADTLAPMGDFEIAKASDINVTIDGTEKRLQTAIDNGEIGGGGSNTFVGTQAEWEALLPTEKEKYEFVDFTDDFGGAMIDDTTPSTDKVYSSSKVESDYRKLTNHNTLDSVTDLNEIKTSGTYGFSSVQAKALANCPTTVAFELIVENPTQKREDDSIVIRLQTVKDFNGNIYTRKYLSSQSIFSEWKQLATTWTEIPINYTFTSIGTSDVNVANLSTNYNEMIVVSSIGTSHLIKTSGQSTGIDVVSGTYEEGGSWDNVYEIKFVWDTGKLYGRQLKKGSSSPYTTIFSVHVK